VVEAGVPLEEVMVGRDSGSMMNIEHHQWQH
jgi:hypothetical protein